MLYRAVQFRVSLDAEISVRSRISCRDMRGKAIRAGCKTPPKFIGGSMNYLLEEFVQQLSIFIKDVKNFRFVLRYNPNGNYTNLIIYFIKKPQQPVVITFPFGTEPKKFYDFLLIVRDKLNI